MWVAGNGVSVTVGVKVRVGVDEGASDGVGVAVSTGAEGVDEGMVRGVSTLHPLIRTARATTAAIPGD